MGAMAPAVGILGAVVGDMRMQKDVVVIRDEKGDEMQRVDVAHVEDRLLEGVIQGLRMANPGREVDISAVERLRKES